MPPLERMVDTTSSTGWEFFPKPVLSTPRSFTVGRWQQCHSTTKWIWLSSLSMHCSYATMHLGNNTPGNQAPTQPCTMTLFLSCTRLLHWPRLKGPSTFRHAVQKIWSKGTSLDWICTHQLPSPLWKPGAKHIPDQVLRIFIGSINIPLYITVAANPFQLQLLEQHDRRIAACCPLARCSSPVTFEVGVVKEA